MDTILSAVYTCFNVYALQHMWSTITVYMNLNTELVSTLFVYMNRECYSIQ